MKMGDALLREFYEKGRSIRRTSWPAGDHIDTDGAEGGTLWYYRAEDDELTPGYRLDFHDLGAGDWEIIDGKTVDPEPLPRNALIEKYAAGAYVSRDAGGLPYSVYIQHFREFADALDPDDVTEAMIKAGDEAYWRKQSDMQSPTPTEEPGIGPIGYAYLAMRRVAQGRTP